MQADRPRGRYGPPRRLGILAPVALPHGRARAEAQAGARAGSWPPYRRGPPPNSLRYMRPAMAIPARWTAIPVPVAIRKSPRIDHAIPNAARDGAATIAATAVPLRSMSLDENGAAVPPALPGNGYGVARLQ